MAAYTMNGTVKVVMDEQTFASGFTKREFVVTTKDDKYPQDIKFEAVKEKISILTDVEEGDDVTVSFNLRGNEYNGKYYVNLNAWKLEKEEGGGVSVSDSDRAPHPAETSDDVVYADDDDLPFA